MTASAVIATNSLYLASESTATAKVRHRDGNLDEAVEEITKAMEALDMARRALRGF